MRNIVRFVFFSTFLILTSCVTQKPIDPAVKAAAEDPLFCQGTNQCANYWRHAQVWVATNSKWKIQNTTDAVITTFTPVDGSMDLGFQVTRLPVAGGLEEIKITYGCGNRFGCRPDGNVAAAAFKAFVRTADNHPVRNVR